MIPLTAILIFILILSFLVFIHELGHFLTARKFGVDVEEFGLGIPPRAWGKKIGRTIYSINWLPLGGFVKIKGEDFENYDPKDKTNFINKKPWQKSLILLAGIIMNTIFGVMIFYFILGQNGWKSNPILLLNEFEFKFGQTVELPNLITFIEDDSPASKAGIEFGDRIVELRFEDQVFVPTNTKDIRSFMSDKLDQEVIVVTQNINTQVQNTRVIIPVYSQELEGPALGVGLGTAVYVSYQAPVDTLFAGFFHAYNVMDYSFSIFKMLISQSISQKDVGPISQGVAGPVGIFGAVKTVLEVGGPNVVITMLDLMALLSISLAFMNLLPIPALDGGRLVFVLAEWVTGKRPSPKLEERAHKIGFLFLIGLIILITLKDIVQLF